MQDQNELSTREREELLELRKENTSLRRWAETLENSREDLKSMLRSATEAKASLVNRDFSDLHYSLSFALRGGTNTASSLMLIIDRWVCGEDISPGALDRLGFNPPYAGRRKKKRDITGWEKEMSREETISLGKRQAARSIIPLLMSLRDGTLKLSEEMEPSAPGNTPRSPEDRDNEISRRICSLRAALDSTINFTETLGESPRGA